MLSVAYGRRWGSNHHDSSADQGPIHNGVFSPVLLDRGNVEDLERQDARLLERQEIECGTPKTNKTS